MSGSIQIPDFAGTIQRGQQLQQQQQMSRLQMLSAQQALDDAERYRTISGPILPQLATAEGPQRLNLLGKLAEAGPQGVALALPQIQQERERGEGRRLIQMALGGGAPAASPAGTEPAAPGGPLPPDLVPRILFGEAGGEGPQGLTAAAHVVLRRSQLTGLTPEQVIQQQGWFEAFGNPQHRARALAATPEQIAEANRIWQGVVSGQIPDPTGGATHYLNPDLQRQLGRAQPAWAPEGQGQRIGRHVFYSLPGDFAAGTPFRPHGAAAPAAPGGGQQPPRGASQLTDQQLLALAASGNAQAADWAKFALQVRAQSNRTENLNPFANSGYIQIVHQLGPLVANGTATPEQRTQYSIAAQHWLNSGNQQITRQNDDGTTQQVTLPNPLPPGFPPPAPLGGAAAAAPQPGAPTAAPAPAPDPNAPQPTTPPVRPLSAADRTRLSTMETDARTIRSALQTFRERWQNATPQERFLSASGQSTPLNSAWNRVALLVKSEAMFNLGVLNGPDLDVLRRTLTDPSTLRSLIQSDAAVMQQVGDLEELLGVKLEETRNQLSGRPPAAAPATPTPRRRNFNDRTGQLE